jgi:hypothetical protein
MAYIPHRALFQCLSMANGTCLILYTFPPVQYLFISFENIFNICLSNFV